MTKKAKTIESTASQSWPGALQQLPAAFKSLSLNKQAVAVLIGLELISGILLLHKSGPFSFNYHVFSTNYPTLFGLPGLLISYLISILAVPMSIYLQLANADRHHITVNDLGNIFSEKLIPTFLFAVFYAVIITIGLCLLIVPGIILAIRYSLGYYLVVDKNLGVADALKTSNEMAKGNALNIVGVAIVTVIISVVISLTLSWLPLIGSIISGLVSITMGTVFASLYRHIEHHPNS